MSEEPVYKFVKGKGWQPTYQNTPMPWKLGWCDRKLVSDDGVKGIDKLLSELPEPDGFITFLGLLQRSDQTNSRGIDAQVYSFFDDVYFIHPATGAAEDEFRQALEDHLQISFDSNCFCGSCADYVVGQQLAFWEWTPNSR